MWTRKFWLDALERALKTAAQTVLGFFTASNVVLDEVDWGAIGLATAIAVGLSFLTSIASSGVGNRSSASLVE